MCSGGGFVSQQQELQFIQHQSNMQDLSCVVCKNVTQTSYMLAQHVLPSLNPGTLG